MNMGQAQHTPGLKRPTPAQRKRLEQIGRGEITRHGKGWVSCYYHCTGVATGGLTYVMMLNLLDAGWIEAKEKGEDKYDIVLTDLGRAAIAKAKGK